MDNEAGTTRDAIDTMVGRNMYGTLWRYRYRRPAQKAGKVESGVERYSVLRSLGRR